MSKAHDFHSDKKLGTDLLVYVFNVVEDEWSFISSISDAVKRFQFISQAEDAADAYFMSLAGEKEFVFISPKAISPAFQEYAQSIFGYRKAHIITPTLRSHLISDDLIADAETSNTLISLGKRYKRVVLTSYAASQEFYSLKEYLERLGIEVYASEAPDFDSSWTVNFFGSKSGIRQLAQQSKALEPDFVMPEGIICVGADDASKIAANRYKKQNGVVIKTNKGSGGDGVLIFREGDLPQDYRECQKTILAYMKTDRYWDMYPVIIEDLININFSLASGFPNVEFKIHKNGRIDLLYVCACKVTMKGKFFGVDINDEVMNDRMQARIVDTGYFIAEQYAAAGYRGHFDVDMIAAKNGQIYVCESNTRNTGGTDTYKIVKHLYGKNFMDDAYTMSRSRSNWLKPQFYHFSDLLQLLSPVLYDKQWKEGVIINSHNAIPEGKLIYTILSGSKKKSYAIEREMMHLLSNPAGRGEEFEILE